MSQLPALDSADRSCSHAGTALPPHAEFVHRGVAGEARGLACCRCDDRVSHGNITLRVGGLLHHIGVGRHLHGTPILTLIDDLEVRVIHAATSEIIRTLTIDPQRRYQGTGAPAGGPRRPYGPRKKKPAEP